MLLAQAFTHLLRRWDFGSLRMLPETLIQDRVVVVLIQLLNRVLFENSSFSKAAVRPYPESVAYDVLTYSALRSLPMPERILSQLDSVIQDGREYVSVMEPSWDSNQYLWIEKITYGCQTLSKAYCIAALHVKSDKLTWSNDIVNLFQPAPKMSLSLSKFFQMVHGPNEPIWKYDACVLEGGAFSERLRSCRAAIFPPRDGFKDKYLMYIPVTWTLINNFRGLNLPTKLIWEMMKFSMLDFLVDEYMESCVAFLDNDERTLVKERIQKHMLPRLSETLTPRKRCFGLDTETLKAEIPRPPEGSERVEAVCTVLNHYVKEVLFCPGVRAASPYDRTQVRTELHDFLIAHIIQMEDNTQLCQSQSKSNPDLDVPILPTPRSSFYTWARTTASQHISCPLSFAFYCCLLSSSTRSKEASDCFPTPEEKYKASDLCTHLAVMSRLLNDYASINRDKQEGNLNSINFPEFHPGHRSNQLIQNSTDDSNNRLNMLRRSLLRLGEYERQASRSVLADLLDEIKQDSHGRSGSNSEMTRKSLQLFAYVTELYADMYVVRDLTNAAQ
jgi:hypothetical protein